MSAWREAVEQAYPAMAKALDAIGELIGNRPIDVFEALVDTDAEAEQLRLVVLGAFEDLRAAYEAYEASPAGRTERTELALRLTLALAGCLQLGVWLGEGGQATLDPNRIRRRLEAAGAAPRQRQPGG